MEKSAFPRTSLGRGGVLGVVRKNAVEAVWVGVGVGGGCQTAKGNNRCSRDTERRST